MPKEIYNKFGLNIRFSDTLGQDINSGTYSVVGNELLYEVDICLNEFHADVTQPVSFNLKTKEGTFLKECLLITSEPAVGGTSFDIGLSDTDGENEVDYDGLFAGVTPADTATVGAVVTGAGALLNTVMTDNSLFTVTTVGEFTAGRVRARLTFERI